jgi:hypothetical protein
MANPTQKCHWCAAPSRYKFCKSCVPPLGQWASCPMVSNHATAYTKRYTALWNAVRVGVSAGVTPVAAPARGRICAACDDYFRTRPGVAGGTLQTYCAPCRSKRRRGEIGPKKAAECRWCFNGFTPSRSDQKCCSNECHRLLMYQQRTHRAPDRCHLKLCMDCCSPIPGFAPSSIRCDSCQTIRTTVAKGINRAKRDAAVRNGDSDIHWTTVGERDGWMCHLCFKRVKRMAGNKKSPRGAVVDHLNPVGDGGLHKWDNVAVAHWDCNTLRGDSGPAQLMLIG